MAIDPTIPIWPDVLLPQRIARRRIHPVNLGPEPISGTPQSVTSDAGRWQFGLLQIPLIGENRLLTWRALIADRCSPLQPIYLPIFDHWMTPRYRASVAQPAGVPFSDGSTFSDGTTFYDQPIDYIVTANAAARAVALTVTAQGPAEVSLTAGNFIGLDERAYVVKKIFDSLDGVAGHYDLTIWPPLRAAATASDPVWTEVPFVKCTIATKSAEASEELDGVGYGFIDIDLDEARW